MIKPLTKTEIEDLLITVPGWQYHPDPDKIECRIEAEDFQGALNWLNKVASLAEESDHHPDVTIHDWNNLKITLTTHAAGGLTQNDFDLAKKINDEVFS